MLGLFRKWRDSYAVLTAVDLMDKEEFRQAEKVLCKALARDSVHPDIYPMLIDLERMVISEIRKQKGF